MVIRRERIGMAPGASVATARENVGNVSNMKCFSLKNQEVGETLLLIIEICLHISGTMMN